MIVQWSLAGFFVFIILGALAIPPSMVVKERTNVPNGWVRRFHADGDHLLSLSIALKPANEDSVYERLEQTSNPDSDEYGKHLSRADVYKLMAPSNTTRGAVEKWLSSYGVNDYGKPHFSPAGDWVNFRAPVDMAHDMLGGADFSVFEHRSTGERVVRTTEYLLPRELSPHVEFVGGTTYFSTPRSLRIPGHLVDKSDSDHQTSIPSMKLSHLSNNSSSPKSCNVSSVEVECLRELYGTVSYKPRVPHKGHIGVAGFLEQNANYEDLAQYLKKERIDAYKGNATFGYVTTNGAVNNQNRSEATSESNLDIQTVTGVSWPIRTTYYAVGGRPPFRPDEHVKKNENEPYAHLNNLLLNLADEEIPSVLSVSYGDDEQGVPEAYARRVCWQYAALGLRGMSVLQSSGDFGVGTLREDACVTNDRKQKKTFLPGFPSACPYVTSVGAVEMFDPEVVATYNISGISSGGGFSHLFERPSYQHKIVPDYVTKYVGKKYRGLYNPNGRAYPDVAAQGSRYNIALNGSFIPISGTSAATPLFASIIALLNDARLSEKKPVLGFLNPLIYRKLARNGVFNDIVNGSAVGCGVDGFPAAQGWDAVTGFGTPNFKKLLEALP